MTDYALPITGTGSSQAVSAEAHDAEVQRAIDEAVAVETAARVAGLATKQPLATVLTNTTAAFTTAQETKLAGIATGATANATDAQLRDRATHTGAQAIATVTGLQAALDGKAAVVHTHTATAISDSTAPGRAVLTAATAAAQRTALGLGTAATTAASDYATAAQGVLAGSAVQPGDPVSDLAETAGAKIMTAAERTKLAGVEAGAQVNTVASVAGKTGAVTLDRGDVGLGSADNTADADKPVSVAQEARIARNEVTRHGAPVGSLIRMPDGSFVRAPNTVPTAAIGISNAEIANTEFVAATVDARAAQNEVTRHGAPTGDLILTPAGVFLRASADLDAEAAVFGGEAWVSTETGGWRVTDGAADGGPRPVFASVESGALVIGQFADRAGYPAGPILNRFALDGAWSFAPTIRRVVAICYHGQSQAVAQNYQVINSTAVSAGRAGMFAGGPQLSTPRSGTMAADDYLTPPARLAGVVDLREGVAIANYESPMSALAANILPHLPTDTGILAINVAIGGQPIENLRHGTAAWANLSLALGVARTMCVARGVAFDVGGLFWSQGGSNAGDNAETYAGKFTSGIYDPWSALMQDHGYGAHEKPIFINAMTHNASNNLGVARAALLLHDDPVRNIIAVGPEYLYTSCNDEGVGDGSTTYTTHISAPGVIHRAYFEALAYKAEVIEAGTWTPLRIVSAIRSGATVTLTLNTGASGMVMPISLASPAIATVSNAGFSWIDNGDGNSVTINGVSVNLSNQIEITLSATPTGTGQAIGYALTATANNIAWQGPVDGARGSVCDSAPGSLTIDGSSYSPRRHLHTDIVSVAV